MILFDAEFARDVEPCDEWRGEIQEHHDGRLGGGRRAAVTAHLAECRACRGYLESLRAMRAALAGLRVVELPSEALSAVAQRRERGTRRSRGTHESRPAVLRRSSMPRRAGWPAAIAAAVLLALLVWPARGLTEQEVRVRRAAVETETTLRLVGDAFERIEQVALHELLDERLAPALRKLPFRLRR